MVALILVFILGSILVPLDYSREGYGTYEHYVENWEDVGAANLVAAVLADWRVYDTMGEAIVLFTSIFGFHILFGGDDDEDVNSG